MIAGIMALHTFQLDVYCLLDLMPRVQHLVLWLDKSAKDRRREMKQLLRDHGQHLQGAAILDADQKWKHCSGHIWREPLLRALDTVRPAYVLQPDSDETFGHGFDLDMADFRASGRDMLFFDYDMPTIDAAVVRKLPAAPHVKVFRWRDGLTFSPYRGYGRPQSDPPGPGGLTAKTATHSRIQHLCFYTPELQAAKISTFSPARQRRFSLRDHSRQTSD